MRHVQLLLDGDPVRWCDVQLADGPTDWSAPMDISPWKGKTLRFRLDALSEGSQALDHLTQSDTIPGEENLYHEPLRGQLHFSPQRGWNNDPNGMVWSQGEYHLFFQFNPYGWKWGNMHWGHAVSRDLVSWQQLPIAIYPRQPNDWVFSGSAVVDSNNTSGWKTGDGDLLVAAFTSTGRGECIAHSNDRGRTWTEFDGNPVVKHRGRDPRLLWYAPGNHWVMAVFDEQKEPADHDPQRCIAFYSSPDLKSWTFQSRIAGFFECPDMFELPLDETGPKKWVLTAADSDYMVGSFDGSRFAPETPKLKGQVGRGFYAAQTFSDEPKGCIVQMGWLQTATPGMPFNQSMSLPLHLKLRSTPEGPRLTREPAEELAALRGDPFPTQTGVLHAGDANPLANVNAEFLELDLAAAPDATSTIHLTIRGIPMRYDGVKQELTVRGIRAALPLRNGSMSLRIFVDRTAIEVFGDDGLVYLPLPMTVDPGDRSASLAVAGGSTHIETLHAFALKSIWDRQE